MSRQFLIWLIVLYSASANAKAAIGDKAEECQDLFRSQQWTKAVESCAIASEYGSADAHVTLGKMYEKGQGLPQDFKAAVDLYLRASRQGLSTGQINLARMYANGRGVNQDLTLAYVWANVAAVTGDLNGLYDRSLYGRRLSSREIARAQELAKRCLASNLNKCD
jgi:TPR repeat protein